MAANHGPEPARLRQDIEAGRDAYTAAGDQNIYHVTVGPGRPAVGPAAFPSVVPPLGQRAETPLRGRDDLVRMLSEEASAGMVHVVHGLGGVGKTRLVLEVAATVMKGGRQVWWVSAVDGPSVSAGMQSVGYAAGATSADFEHANKADVVWWHLTRYPDPWLLVLDNADDPAVALSFAGTPVAHGQGWVRNPPEHGYVLITTRDGSTAVWGTWTRPHRMAPLEIAPGARVLLDLAPAGGTASSAELLAERLGGLPLALQLAGKAIAQAAAVPLQWANPLLARSFDAYRTTLAERFSEVFKPPASGPIEPHQARGLVGQTWELSLAVLDSRSIPEARRLLRLLSCFGDAPVPCGLLVDPAILAESELFPAMTGQRLFEVLTALDSLSLITLDVTSARGEVGPMAVVHPLVRDTNRVHPEVRDAADIYYRLVADLLSNAAGKTPLDQAGILVAHIAEPLANPLTPPPDSGASPWPGVKLRELAVHVAHDLDEQVMYAHAEALLQAVLTNDARRVGSDHPDTLAARQVLARVWCGQGRFAEAEQALTGVLAVREEQVGGDHPDTLATRQELALVWSQQTRLAEAEQAYTSILAVREERLGHDHPDTLATRQALAFVWCAQGRFAEAEQAYTSILAIREKRFGPDHPDTLIARHELARVWCAQGRFAETEQALTDVLAVREERFGRDHPDTLMAWQELALAWRDQGRLAEAEQALTSVLAIREKRLGPDHAYNVGTRQLLASVWRNQGRLAEAEQALTDILAASGWLGPDHQFNLSTRHELALVWRNQGRLAEAEQALTSVLAIRQERRGPDHPHILSTRHELALVRRDQGRLVEAEQALTSVMALREQRLGSNHPDTIATRTAINAAHS
jgi:tetratricopeptide (TPR) repeat protein